MGLLSRSPKLKKFVRIQFDLHWIDSLVSRAHELYAPAKDVASFLYIL